MRHAILHNAQDPDFKLDLRGSLEPQHQLGSFAGSDQA